MDVSNKMNIVFCCDDVYSTQLKIAAYSLLSNTKQLVGLYIIDCGISEERKQSIFALREKFSNLVDIQFNCPEKIQCFEEFPISLNFSCAIFYRLMIPQSFPELERAIYLDCDVIVDADIFELWQTDLRNCSFGALNAEGNFFLSADVESRKRKVGIPLTRTYINSGVLLIDIKKFLSDHVLDRVIAVLKTHKKPLACPEQDAMNICIKEEEYYPIDPKFNFTPFANLAKSLLKKGLQPVIIHFSCGKPWCFNRKLVNYLYRLGFFHYDLDFIKKYWLYSDAIDLNLFDSGSIKLTLRFLYKRFFGKIEYFFAKKVRNRITRWVKQIFNIDSEY